MRLFRQKECPPEVMRGLEGLLTRADLAKGRKRIIDCYIFYAITGRDRAKLTMDWVAKAEQGAKDDIAFQDALERALKGR